MAVMTAVQTRSPAARHAGSVKALLPGILICVGVSAVAYAIESAEAHLLGRPYLEALVLAILVGTVVRTLWTPPASFQAGINFCAKLLLEIAVMLLGASLTASALAAAGAPLLAAIAGVVVAALAISYGIGRAVGLPHMMALLVACGNSICGNSAIAAVAAVTKADSKDVASSIAFTAILGVILVLCLPLAAPLLNLTELQYGALAGLTVYAVPQVLAATSPIGALAVQFGTLVKLVRVVMLGPVVFGVALLSNGRASDVRLPFFKLVPWFIIGFVALAFLRSFGAVPEALLGPMKTVTVVFTVLSMAALGLGVDLKTLRKVGGRVTAAVVLSILSLALISFAVIHLIHLG